MKIFNCNVEWPICLFNFTHSSINPTYLCFHVKNDLTEYALEGYFYGQYAHLQQESQNFQPGLIVNVDKNIRDELLFERN